MVAENKRETVERLRNTKQDFVRCIGFGLNAWRMIKEW